MKILFVQHQGFINGQGGTEKMCSFLANLFVEQGHEVRISTCENVIGKPIFPLLKEVVVHNIYRPEIKQIKVLPYINYSGNSILKWIGGKIKKKYAKAYNRIYLKWRFDKNEEEIYAYNLLQRAKVWNEFLNQQKPSIIITMSLQSVVEITFQNDIQIPIINSVNGRPDYDYAPPFRKLFHMEEQLLRAGYKQMAGLQVLLPSYQQYVPKDFKGIAKTIANPVLQVNNERIVDHLTPKKRYKMMHLGTLNTYCKQQDLAIQAFALLANKYPNWDLEFWGEGNDKIKLEKLIKSYGLSDRIFLKGFTSQPIQVLKEASLFVFPSKFEGFPLALVEAMAVGLPCVGFASCSGVNELIQHKTTGYLVNDLQELVIYLDILMGNPQVRADYGILGNCYSKDFQEQLISEKWIELIKEIKNKYVSKEEDTILYA